MDLETYLRTLRSKASGGSEFKAQSSLRELFSENQINPSVQTKPHPLTGISRSGKKESL